MNLTDSGDEDEELANTKAVPTNRCNHACPVGVSSWSDTDAATVDCDSEEEKEAGTDDGYESGLMVSISASVAADHGDGGLTAAEEEFRMRKQFRISTRNTKMKHKYDDSVLDSAGKSEQRYLNDCDAGTNCSSGEVKKAILTDESGSASSGRADQHAVDRTEAAMAGVMGDLIDVAEEAACSEDEDADADD